MTGADRRLPRALTPLLVLGGVVLLVTIGFAHGGLWPANLHNGLLALSFAGVGTYLAHERPGHRSARLFLAAGAVEGVLFLGRQVGEGWLGWLGVWPVALALGVVTLSVLTFPDGRLPSPRWRPVAVVVCGAAVVLAVISALWPVEYAATGLDAQHPLDRTTPSGVQAVWDVVAHPTYALLQSTWVVALVVRWRSADGVVRTQVFWLAAAAVLSLVALLVGLVGWGTPVPGLLATSVVPVTAGWAVVHGQRLATYSALSWVSRSRHRPAQELPHDLARAAAEAVGAEQGAVWMTVGDAPHAVGVWPLGSDPDLGNAASHVRDVHRDGAVIGHLSVAGPTELTGRQSRLLDDLAAQAALVLDQQSLAAIVQKHREAGHLDGLTPRERQVLDLMAKGLSNAAIGRELHLSIKTVEPLVSAVFTRLELLPDADANRRVLAVLAYLRLEAEAAAQGPP